MTLRKIKNYVDQREEINGRPPTPKQLVNKFGMSEGDARTALKALGKLVEVRE